jgi:hypothetical protein
MSLPRWSPFPVLSLPPKASLLLVGDVDQLPSVGPGMVLRHLIESGVVPVRATDRGLPPGSAQPDHHHGPPDQRGLYAGNTGQGEPRKDQLSRELSTVDS